MSNKIIAPFNIFLFLLFAGNVLAMEEKYRPLKKRKIKQQESLADSGYLSELPDEVKLNIIKNYLAVSIDWNNIKSIHHIESYIKQLPLAQANKGFRNLFQDKAHKFILIKYFVQNYPERAIKDLTQASLYGDLETVNTLIQARLNVNDIGSVSYAITYPFGDLITQHTERGTPLEFAVKWKDPSLNNSEVNINEDEKPNLKIIRALLNAGADPNKVTNLNQFEPLPHTAIQTPLFSIIYNDNINNTTRDKIALDLLKAGANPNSYGYDQGELKSALDYAIEKSYFNIVQNLLAYGAGLPKI